ncbi:MAG: hypothetical protein GYB65_07940 [Chloroflexi bacterium]|nr:hypothetical protein [Chloroflexota bacterium]
MTKSRSSSSSNTQRLTLGGVAGFILVAAVLFAQYGLGIDLLGEEDGDSPAVVQETSVSGDWYALYFTAPGSAAGESELEQALVDAIDGATVSVDAALFELNSDPITQALIRAHNRSGVTVRVVTDGQHGMGINEESPKRKTMPDLVAAGVSVVSDNTRGGFMHNKFVVIDGAAVWTGSTNLTENGIYRNNNNAILIQSTALAQNYTAEFEELYAGEFGKTSPDEMPNPSIVITDQTTGIETEIETFFESEGEVSVRLAELFEDADTVRFMAFSFTDSLKIGDDEDRDLVSLLVSGADAGQLDVQGIVENSQRSYLGALICSDAAQVRRDGNPNTFHHKVFIIDASIVVTGSFNFSNSADNDNDENILIIHNTEIARAYLDEFDRRWAEAVEVPIGEGENEISCPAG